jgi:hypothetical protein
MMKPKRYQRYRSAFSAMVKIAGGTGIPLENNNQETIPDELSIDEFRSWGPPQLVTTVGRFGPQGLRLRARSSGWSQSRQSGPRCCRLGQPI